MHVGVLVHSWLDDAEGGGNRVAHDLARFLHGRGHRITAVVPALTSDSIGQTDITGFRVVRYPWRAEASGLGRWHSHITGISRTLRDIHHVEPFDVVHSHGVLQGLGVLASRVPAPMVQTVHAPVSLEAPYRRMPFRRLNPTWWKYWAGDTVLHQLEGMVLGAAARITCLSRFMLTELRSAHPWLRRSIDRKGHVLRGGTNLRVFSNGMTREQARAALGWGREPVILAARRLEPRMGLDLLLDACALARRTRRGLRCVIAGRGSLAASLQQRRDALGLQHCVEFAGFVPDQALRLLYTAADAVVMPSLGAEGFGLAGIEALASGTPIVVTPVGANAEIAGSIYPRFVASAATPGALARAIDEVLISTWYGDELARACVGRFGIDAVGPEYERLLAHTP